MKKALIHKHDELAKKFLTDLDVAKEFLAIYLPSEILNKCDLSTLIIESGSYIDNELRKRFSDIVYKVTLNSGNGYAYIYTLVEHQSSAVKLMPLRILKYQMEIIFNHVKNYGEDEPLPVVIPVVFYNGDTSPYPYPTDIKDLVVDGDLFATCALGRFKLVDLTVTDDKEILQHKKVALLEMVLKHIKAKEFISAIEPIFKSLLVAHMDSLPKDLFDSLLSYLTQAKDVKELKPLFDRVIVELSEYKEDVMTYAEHYRQEGEQRGRQDTQREIAQTLLRSGVDSTTIANATHLTPAQIEDLRKAVLK